MIVELWRVQVQSGKVNKCAHVWARGRAEAVDAVRALSMAGEVVEAVVCEPKAGRVVEWTVDLNPYEPPSDRGMP